MRQEIFWLVIGMSLVTALPRVLPVALLSRLEFPARLKEWLSYIAPAVLGGLLAVSILAPRGAIDLSPGNTYIWAFVPTMLVAVFTRSLLYTMVTGIGVMALCNHLLGF